MKLNGIYTLLATEPSSIQSFEYKNDAWMIEHNNTSTHINYERSAV